VRHAVLRRILGQYLGKSPGEIEFTQNSFGKPAVASSASEIVLEFNMSGSSDWGLAGFSLGRPLGVDIEKVRKSLSWTDIASRFFHAREVSYINELPENQRPAAFYRHWTLKEAFIKACGVGLNRSLLEIDFTPLVLETAGRYQDVDGTNWFCVSFCPGEDLVAALAVKI